MASSDAAEITEMMRLPFAILPAVVSSRKGVVNIQINQMRQSFVVVFIGFPPDKLLRQINYFRKDSDIFYNSKLFSHVLHRIIYMCGQMKILSDK